MMASLWHFVVVLEVILCASVLMAVERHFKLREDAAIGSVVADLRKEFAIPHGLVPFFVPTLPSMNYDSYFHFNSDKAILTTSKRLDREHLCSATGLIDPCIFSFAIFGLPEESHRIHIEVIDVNDNPPKFSKKAIKLFIPESDFVGMKYDLCLVTDEDLGNNSFLRIKSQTKSDFFEVLSTSKAHGTLDLTLELKKKLDREEQKVHQLLVTVEDAGEPSLSSMLAIEIHVLDVNDNHPVFAGGERSTVRIPEDAMVGSIVAKLTATDRDEGPNGRVTYGISRADPSTRETFVLGTMTGEVGLYKKLDYETSRRYEMVVLAADMGRPSLSSTSTVVFEVTDTNDNPPVISLTYLNSKSHGEIIENKYLTSSGKNETLIAVVSIQDDDGSPENNQVTCSCTDHRFSLVEHSRFSRILLTEHLFDRETEPRLTFKLICKDNGHPQLTSSATIEIEVKDTNDNEPSFERARYEVSVDENLPPGEFILQVHASDADEGNNGIVEYELEGDEHVTIDRESGVVSVRVPFDHETSSGHLYKIIARDKGMPTSLTSVATLEVHVNDLDEPPTFVGDVAILRVTENQAPLTRIIGQLKAIDPDQSENFTAFTFFIDGDQPFSIDEGGILYSKVSLDRESAASHSLRVCVKSKNDDEVKTCTDLTILVDDLNDNAPKFVQPEACHQRSMGRRGISKFLPRGSEVITFTAVDDDLGARDDRGLRFELVETQPGVLRDLLYLNETSGKLSLMGDLTTIDSHSIEIVAQVSEINFPEHYSRCVLAMELTNETISDAMAGSLSSAVEGRNLMVVAVASASTLLVLLLTGILLALLLCKMRRGRGRKGRPVRPDLIQNGRKSTDPVHFRDVPLAESFTGPSSTLTLDTFPTLSTFSKDHVIASLKRKKRDGEGEHQAPSEASSCRSGSRDEFVSLMVDEVTKHQAVPVSKAYDIEPMDGRARSFGSRKGCDRGSRQPISPSSIIPSSLAPSIASSFASDNDPQKYDPGLSSIHQGNYICYNDLY